MEYKDCKLSMIKATEIANGWDKRMETSSEQVRKWARFEVSSSDYDPLYAGVRKEVVAVFEDVLRKTGKTSYELDLEVGLKLYELLDPKKGFDIVTASDDDVWRYISMKAMPDITFVRYPNLDSDADIIRGEIPEYRQVRAKPEQGSNHIRKKRFYSHTRRIWLKTLWWYIHLGWQGTSEKTYKVLRKNGTDTISHFIERPGKGYRTNLFREMMLAYSGLPRQSTALFRAAAKLNLAKCVTVEPALTEGGERGYSERLFNEVCIGEAGKNDDEGDDSE